jgi:hypothetical protein
MPAIVNVTDFIKIALISYAFIFAANKALEKVGMSQYKA